MQISPINCTNFSASITFPSNYLSYIEKHSVPKEGHQDFSPHKIIIEKLKEAFSKNPSDAVIQISQFDRTYELFNARGTICSQYKAYTDTEPARSDSTAPIENIIRRILNPENRAQFNELMGAKKQFTEQNNPQAQDKWWNEYIAPIWEDIQKEFYEATIYPRSKDADFNKEFRKQSWLI